MEKWEKGMVIECGGKKLLWDWEYKMRTNCTARRPDLTVEDNERKQICIVNMAWLSESNGGNKRLEKSQKYQHYASKYERGGGDRMTLNSNQQL